MIINKNIIIEDGGNMSLLCRMSMVSKSSIMIKSVGKLVLDKCRLHTDCVDTWKGIIAERPKSDIEYRANVKIESKYKSTT